MILSMGAGQLDLVYDKKNRKYNFVYESLMMI